MSGEQLAFAVQPIASPDLVARQARELFLRRVLAELRAERYGLGADEIARRLRAPLRRVAHGLRVLEGRGAVVASRWTDVVSSLCPSGRLTVWAERGKRASRVAWEPYPRRRRR